MEQYVLFLTNQKWISPGLDLFMAAMSSLALWTVPIVITLLLVAWFGGFKARAMLVVLLVALGFGGGVVCDRIKKSVHRPRPRELRSDVRCVNLANVHPLVLSLFKPADIKQAQPVQEREKRHSCHSFPSAHAFNNFCVAMVLALFYRRWGWLYFFPASLVAYSRLYVGAHWITDVIAGALLGCGIALLTVALLSWLWRKYGQKVMPKTHAAHPSLLAL